MSRAQRVLVVPDSHHPYVDRRAWKVLLAAGKEFRPDILINLGDHGDFYCISSHRKDPNLPHRLEHEIAASNAALDQLDALGAKKKFFIAGNHENRLANYLADRAPAVANMLKVPDLFRLEKRGWGYTPYGKVLRIGRTCYAHDPSGCGVSAHIRAALKAGRSIVHGHTHRVGYSVLGNIDGEKRFGLMLGWLGNAAEANYCHDLGKEHDWAHAFGQGYMESNGDTTMFPVLIQHGRARLVDGTLVTA